MTKKEFKELVSVHKYGRGRNPNNLTAIFFDWKTNNEGNGFKYCVFARNVNAKRDELINMLYDFINGDIPDVPWYVQLIMAMSDKQRFKVPLDSGGLNTMRKVEPIIQKV